MKVYTGGGDKGKTSLFSGERVPKHHIRIEAYGDLDELNSILGVVASSLPEGEQVVRDDFDRIQSNLFLAGAWLATTPDSSATGYLTVLPLTVSKRPGKAHRRPFRCAAGTEGIYSTRWADRLPPGRMLPEPSAGVASGA